MKIEHIAIWVKSLEEMKDFYTGYFSGKAGEKYTNPKSGFESYFLEFETGSRLELMKMPGISENANTAARQSMGYIHLAFSAGTRHAVDELTRKLESSSYSVVSPPRTTGDGCYESCVLDPEGNRVEITI